MSIESIFVSDKTHKIPTTSSYKQPPSPPAGAFSNQLQYHEMSKVLWSSGNVCLVGNYVIVRGKSNFPRGIMNFINMIPLL